MKRASRLPQWPPQLPAMPGWFRWRMIPKLALALITTGVLVTLVLFHLDYFQVGANLEQFRTGLPAPRDVKATDTIKWIDLRETARLRDEAAERVPVAESLDQKAEVVSLQDLDHLFAAFSTTIPTPSDKEKSGRLALPPEITAAAHQLTPDAANRLHTSAQSILRSVMSTRIGEGRVEARALAHMDTLAKARVHDPGELRILITVLHTVVRPNWVTDPLLTERRREEARNAVSPVTHQKSGGEFILQKGEIVAVKGI